MHDFHKKGFELIDDTKAFQAIQAGSPQPQRAQWQGHTQCDSCSKECGKLLYDVKTLGGYWAVLCEECWPNVGNAGLRLGLNLGQLYSRDADGNYYITRG